MIFLLCQKTRDLRSVYATLFLLGGFFVSDNFTAPVQAASPAVDIEVLHEGFRSPVAAQQWAEILGRAGFARVSIRGRKSGDTPSIENIGTSQYPRYRVTALLRDDKIILPPFQHFGKRDRGRIESWIEQLQKGGPDTPENPRGPFGLSDQQLNRLRRQLATRVQEKTRGVEINRVVDQLLRELKPAMIISTRTRQEFATRGLVTNELEGVATGTALAAVLRPLGWGLKPKMRQDKVVWTIVKKQPTEAVWPVGWESDQSAARTLPVLGQQVETQKVTLSLNGALHQLAARMQVPIIFDSRELAAQEIDLSTKVSMRGGKLLYSAVLRHLLHQVRLSFAVRLDDGAEPFLWVSTYQSLKSP